MSHCIQTAAHIEPAAKEEGHLVFRAAALIASHDHRPVHSDIYGLTNVERVSMVIEDDKLGPAGEVVVC